MSAKLPIEFEEYFWDVNFAELDQNKNWFLIVKRLLDRGNTQAIKWVISTYGVNKIKEVLLTTKDLDTKTANFWTGVLNLDPSKVPCLNKLYSPIHFGLYS